jgi:hypothetical protein
MEKAFLWQIEQLQAIASGFLTVTRKRTAPQ